MADVKVSGLSQIPEAGVNISQNQVDDENGVSLRYLNESERRGGTQTFVWNTSGRMTGFGLKISWNAKRYPLLGSQEFEIDIHQLSDAISGRRIVNKLATYPVTLDVEMVVPGTYIYFAFDDPLPLDMNTAYGLSIRPVAINDRNHLHLAAVPGVSAAYQEGVGSLTLGSPYLDGDRYGREPQERDFDLVFFTTSEPLDDVPSTVSPDKSQAPSGSIRLFPSPRPSPLDTQNLWNIDELFKTPVTHDASATGLVEKGGIVPVFYDGVACQGRSTRIFAWLGIPQVKDGDKVPAIVLVHGGGGTAFRDWVKLWMDRGYAAIAMDATGSVPLSEDGMNVKSRKHSYAPVTGLNFAGSEAPPDSQWIYHAVAAVVRANSLLRSLPQIDPEKIGVTGISWGGVLSEIAIGIDPRFKFAAPVYGCGFLGENSFWLETEFQKLPPAQVERWISLWDPSQYLSGVCTPVLFCNGTNDKHFRPDSWQKTYRLPSGPVTLSLKVGMGHAHPPVGDPKEITVFADSIVKNGVPPLPVILKQDAKGGLAWVVFTSEVPVRKVYLVYTTDSGEWVARRWQNAEADIEGNQAKAKIPEGTSAYYFNIIDDRGCIVSSPHRESKTTHKS